MAPSPHRRSLEDAEGGALPRRLAVAPPHPPVTVSTLAAPTARPELLPSGLDSAAALALVSVGPLTAGRLIRVNPAFAELLGETPAALRGRDLADFLRREDPDDEGQLAQVLDGQLARAGGLRQLLTTSGELVVCQFTALRAGSQSDDRPAAVVSLTPLSTALSRARGRAQAAREAVSAAPYGVAIFDVHGDCLLANLAWTALGGATEPDHALLATPRDAAAARAAAAAAASGSGQDLTLEASWSDGTPCTVHMVLAPRTDHAGVAAGYIAYAHAVGVPVASAHAASAADDPDTVGPGVVARTLGVSQSTVRRWIEDGHMDAARTAGGHRRIRRSELRRVASTLTRQCRVRTTDLPGRGLPVLAAVLEHHGAVLVRVAVRGTYVAGSPGWFAEPAAARPLRAWGSTASRAIADGRAPDAVAASRILFEAARDVAGLEECLVFADRLSALILRRLAAEPGGSDELDDARTILAAMRRSLAALEDARAQSR